jgi:hypothetical protein
MILAEMPGDAGLVREQEFEGTPSAMQNRQREATHTGRLWPLKWVGVNGLAGTFGVGVVQTWRCLAGTEPEPITDSACARLLAWPPEVSNRAQCSIHVIAWWNVCRCTFWWNAFDQRVFHQRQLP